MREGYQGPYAVILYDQNAQRYILDHHLDQISEINQMRRKNQADPAWIRRKESTRKPGRLSWVEKKWVCSFSPC